MLSPADIFSSSRILFIAHSSAFAIANSFSSCNRLNSLSFSRNSISACNFADFAAASIKARERCFVEEELNFDLSDDLDFLLKLDFSDGVRLDFLSKAWMRSQTNSTLDEFTIPDIKPLIRSVPFLFEF